MRSLIVRELFELIHRHRGRPQGASDLHPLDPLGAGGKIALYIVESLDTIIRNQEVMKEQLDRLNAVIAAIGSKIGTVKTDLDELLGQFQAHVAGEGEVNIDEATRRLEALVINLGTIDQAITNSSHPAAGSLTGGVAPIPDSKTEEVIAEGGEAAAEEEVVAEEAAEEEPPVEEVE